MVRNPDHPKVLFSVLAAAVLFSILCCVAFSFLTTPASAQMPNIYLPKTIMGNYSNPDFGIQITLPKGWSGNEIRTPDLLTAIAAPGGLMTQTNSTILLTIILLCRSRQILQSSLIAIKRLLLLLFLLLLLLPLQQQPSS